jgi:hypothetical protein
MDFWKYRFIHIYFMDVLSVFVILSSVIALRIVANRLDSFHVSVSCFVIIDLGIVVDLVVYYVVGSYI